MVGIAACCLVAVVIPVRGAARNGRPGKPSAPVLLILDRKGKLVQKNRCIFLSGRHLGVSVRDFQRLGFVGGLFDDGRKVSICEGENAPDACLCFTLNGNSTYSPAAEDDSYQHYSFPVARRIGKQVYVSLAVMQQGFTDFFAVAESGRMGAVTIRAKV